ncbi:MAG: DUF2911 domain-containing protein [Chitinophagaceae bacterium]
MRKILHVLAVILLPVCLSAQIPLTVLPSGGNKKASVSERVGLTDITIHYDRPGVKGREGKIWGQLVQPGFTDPGFGTAKAAPWRAGANENTVFEFSTDVKIEGQTLTAGAYGFFIAYDPGECTLIFSKNHNSWGSFFYNEQEDALRVKVRPRPLDKSVEWLKYEFSDQTENSAVISLQWEKLAIPFRVEVDYIREQLASFRKELRTEKGFIWQSWDQAAQWCLQRNINLEEALLWSDSASGNFAGNTSFQAHSTKAQILRKLGRVAEADLVMKKAMPFAGIFDLHQYGRQLLNQKAYAEAFDVFRMNYEKNPGNFTTCIGMARGYSGKGDFKKALSFAQQALPLAPDSNNRKSVLDMIEKLKAGKDIN